jgi:hypothetical protein
VNKLEIANEQMWLIHKELNDQFIKYEESNLKIYSKDDKQLDSYMLFKHPMKAEVKEKLDTMVIALTLTHYVASKPDESL